jgi:hypothetical protein
VKRLIIDASLCLVVFCAVLIPEKAQASYEEAWKFVCDWDCGEAMFEPEYGGYTVHGYSSSFFDKLPTSISEAEDWTYYDYWLPAGCANFSTVFSQTVCLDTAFFHGVGAWQYFSSLYWDDSDDDLACKVISERAAARDDNSPYAEGWHNRDAALAALGECW